MKRRPRLVAVLPTLLTLGNAACGFGAITIAAKIGPENMAGNELFIASLLVYLAMLFDALDGSAARWANQTSEFGAQLDSLCDAISFGVAPAFLMLQYQLIERANEQTLYPSRIIWVIGVLFALCALLRLARFNVETDEDDSHDAFSGLPSPAAAGTVVSFPIAIRGIKQLAANDAARTQDFAEWLIPAIAFAMPLMTLAVAVLMVSKVRYPHVFNQVFRGERSRKHVIQVVFTLAALFLVREMAVPLIFGYFAFAAPIQAAWREFGPAKVSRQSDVSGSLTEAE